jgi:pimeloyl-ACP methyl ester carboxylesterase
MAGDADKIVDYRQAQRLQGEIPGSHLDLWPGASHMIHHIDPGRFLRGIDIAAERLNAGVVVEQI